MKHPLHVLTLMLAMAIAPAWAAPGSPDRDEPTPTYVEQVGEALRWGDLDALERLYAKTRATDQRSPVSGRPAVDDFWSAIFNETSAGSRRGEGFYLQLDALTARWARQHPDSTLAALLHASGLQQRAWYHRGDGYRDSVSAQGAAEFERLLTESVERLQEARQLASRDSAWNLLMLRAARGLGWDLRRQLELFDDGLRRNPDHDALYFAMQASLLPKWGGSQQLVERFIAEAVRRTEATRGLEMYARLFAAYSDDQVKLELFTETRASWPSMKAGFEDRLRRHPMAGTRTRFAHFACLAGDRETLREQLELLGDRFERDAWGPNPERRRDECRRLARQS